MLPRRYESKFEVMLNAVANSARDVDVPLVPFWPLVGGSYDRELLVVGRSVNGWVNDWTAGQLRDESIRRQAVADIRADAEPEDRDRMAWVVDLWGNTHGYSTARSAFWRVIRRISAGDGVADDAWPSRLVWTNLYKVSPAAGWNPGADLQRAQRASAIEMLRIELEELAPRRVLALTGGWIAPFVDGLELAVTGRSGLVEGLAKRGSMSVVVAKHPMAKPGDRFVREVLEAFDELGAPIPARQPARPA